MLTFDALDIHAALDAAADEELERATFGVIRLNEANEVVHYNAWEARLANRAPEEVLGRPFFSEIAPCTNNSMVAQRFEDPLGVDTVIDYEFRHERMRPTRVRLRLLRSPSSPWRYVLVTQAPRAQVLIGAEWRT